MMALEVGRLVGQDRIGSGVRLIEAVAGEFEDQFIDGLGGLLVDVLFGAALDELHLHPGHDVFLLLPHGPAENIRFSEAEAAQVRRDAHHLLLVDDDPISLLQDRGQQGMEIFDRLPPELAVDVGVDILHRAGPVEGVHGDQVLDAVGLQLAEIFLHPLALELEDPHGIAVAKDLVGGGIVQGDLVDVDRRAAFRHHLHALADHRQGAQAQEVHLQQPDLLAAPHGKLGGDHLVLVLIFGLVEGHKVGNIVRSDDDPGGMHRGMAGEPFQHLGMADQLLVAGIAVFGDLHQFRDSLKGLLQFQRLALVHRDRFRDAVGIGIIDLQHPGHILDHPLGSHGAEGDDLGHVGFPVLAPHVFDHLFPALEAEIDVDIRHGHPLGIEETLEQQIVADRIHVGDPQSVGHQAAGGGAPPQPHRNSLGTGVVDEVLHNQEVAGKAGLADHRYLILQALHQGIVQFAVVAFGALKAQLLQIVVQGKRLVFLRQRELGQFVHP